MSSGVAVVNIQCAVNGTLGMLQSAEEGTAGGAGNAVNGGGTNAAGINAAGGNAAGTNAAAANAAPNATSA